MTATDWTRQGVPARWAGQPAFTALHLGPGSVEALLTLCALWRDNPQRSGRLYLVADAACRPGNVSADAAALGAAWPVEAPGWHRVSTGDGRVHWLLRSGSHPGDDWTRLVLQADAVAGMPQSRLATSGPGGWTPTTARALSRLVQPGATLWLRRDTDAAHGASTAALRSAGFTTDPALAGDVACAVACTDGTVLHHRPHPSSRRPPTRGSARRGDDDRVIVLGGGLAGCAVAEALAEHGRDSTVLDRHPSPAGEASGNPVGLFHGIVTPDDGLHARFNRAAALDAQRRVARAVADDGVGGSAAGLLRLQIAAFGRSVGRAPTVSDMRATLARLGLPPDYVDAIDAVAASSLAGVRIDVPAWWFPGGGWVDPAALTRAMLRSAGARATWRGGVAVDSLRRVGSVWELRDAGGGLVDAGRTVVLANAAEAQRLLGRPAWMASHLTTARGQLSGIHGASRIGVSPRVPMTGSGYVSPPWQGISWFGATSHADDADPRVRMGDHAVNLARLGGLVGVDTGAIDPVSLEGRTAWRWITDDRLPLIGAMPDATAHAIAARPSDQPRHVPRLPGLYLHTALGGRGITWSMLGGRLLAAMLTGAPLPLTADLVDAVDPARFVARAARGGNRMGHGETSG